ncbi:T9SS type B sorting domain-containing protein [Flavilitoribacter nigricans]|uniref:T9SS type B sorting domain-containing protein n=1 Tax=Flavilitoribacter nigricans TaxID=70997 RepID=UPI001C9E9D24|nr:gliding motility-associated C-terminal domain-containing protein [Flavilitoribacter nigricans]
MITRTFTVTDDCLNVGTDVQTITIDDTTAPVVTAPDDDAIEACDVATGLTDYSETPVDITGQEAAYGLTVTEACDYTVTYVDTQAGTCPIVITRTFTVTDECLNIGTDVQTITIDDTTAPVVTAPDDDTIEACDATTSLPDYSETPVDITGQEGNYGLTITEACNYTTTYVDTQTGTCPVVITRTFTVTDECLNVGTDVQTITIGDTTDPVVTAPDDDTIEACDVGTGLTDYSETPVDITGQEGAYGLTITEACNYTTTYVDTQTGTCPVVITRTFTVTDDCLKVGTDVQTITIDDTTAPVVTAPDDDAIEACDVATGLTDYSETPVDITGQEGAYGLTVTEACDYTVTYVDTQAGTCPIVITRTFTVTDECLNVGTDVQTITIDDTTAPVVTAPDDDTIEACDATTSLGDYSETLVDITGQEAAYGLTITEACDYTTTYIDTQTGSCPVVITRTFTVTDECLNVGTDVQTITIDDTTAPVVTAPDDDTIEACDVATGLTDYSETPVDITGQEGAYGLTITETCNYTTTYVDTQTGTCPIVITRTFTVTDDCLNVGTDVQTITIDDTTAPVVTAPDDDTIEACDVATGLTDYSETPVDITGQEAAYGLTVTEACDYTVTYVDMQAGTCPIVITRTFTVTDECLNVGTDVQTITIDDTTAPVVTAPDDDTIEACDATTSLPDYSETPVDITGQEGNYGLTITEACNYTTTYVDTQTGTCPVVITRTFTVTDECLNVGTDVQTITIGDTTDPVVTAPDDDTIEACDVATGLTDYSETPVDITGQEGAYGLTITEACNYTTTYVDTQTGTCPIVITRTFTVTDDCLNVGTDVQTITIDDTTAPVVTAPDDDTIEACDVATGLTDYSETPVDITGQEGAYGLTVTEACDYTVTYVDIQTGSCPIVITRTFTVTDECLNVGTDVQTITIDDTTAPVVTAPDDDTIEACDASTSLGDYSETPVDITGQEAAYGLTITEACDYTTTYVDTQTGSCPVVITRTFTVTDECLNVGTDVQTITIDDTTAPVVTAPDDDAIEACDVATGLTDYSETPVDITGQEGTYGLTITETCNYTTTYVDTQTGTCPIVITRTFTVTDDCLNVGTDVQTITIDDTTAPVVTAPDDDTIESCDVTTGLADYSETPVDITGQEGTYGVTVDEACDYTITYVDTQTGTCPIVITRTFTVTDECLNVGTDVQTITIGDTTDPVVTAPDDVVFEACDATTSLPDYSETPVDITGQEGVYGLSVTEACDYTITYVDTQTGTCPIVITRTFTVTDECLNVGTDVQTITIGDTTDPVVTAPDDDTVEACDVAGGLADYSETPVDITGQEGTYGVTVTEACDYTVTYVDTQSGTCPIVITRTFTVTDECQNVGTDVQIITIEDTTSPTVNCPGDVTVSCSAEVPVEDITLINALDNCGSVTVTFVQDVSDNLSCSETITRTYRVTDDCGNTADCEQLIVINDLTAPVFEDPPADVTVECIEAVLPAPDLTWTDNCDGSGSVPGIDTDNGGSYTRTWTYTDACGNTTAVTQVITIGVLAVSLEPVAPLCINAGPQQIIVDKPGGTWTGAVNTNGMFNPAANGAGVHMVGYIYMNAEGCQATDEIAVTVLARESETIDQTICEGESLTINGNTYENPGIYTDTIPSGSVNGCDSILNINLIVLESDTVNIAETICEGATYNLGNQSLTTTGTYQATFTAENGCDSLVVLDLTVLPAYEETLDEEICDGESYGFGSQTLTTGGTYTETFTAENGCDSTVTLNLTILPTFTEAVAADICDGDSYEFGTQTLTIGGTYTEVFTAANGCDSTVTLTLTVLPTFAETITAEICDGDSYELGTQTLTIGGTYTEVFTAANGCDSTVTLTLTILPIYVETVDAEICDGDSYELGTQTLTTGGTYTEVFTAANGCDSTVTLNLTVLPILTETIDAEICDDDFYTFGNQNISTPGTYTETFTSSIGCDSVVTLNLTVLPTFTEAVAADICDGESYEFGPQTLTTGGTYTEIFTAANGCDSTVTLTLTILPTFTETIDAEICDGDSYEFGPQTLTTGGTYTEVFTAANGCDSTVTLNLTILPTFTETVDAEICDGDSYEFGTQTLTTDGTYTEVFTASNGCDSTVTLNLTVLPILTETIDAEICDNDFYTFGNQNISTPGTYTETFTSSIGCDSTVTLNLTVLPTFTEAVTAEICDGDSYEFGTQTLTTGGTYTEIFTAANGCDSTVTLTLTILPTFTETIDAEICDGDSYEFGPQTLTTGGTYTEVFTAANGCDSTVTLNLTILPTFTETVDVEICDGDSFEFGTQTLTADGTYTEVFTAANGCDSTVTLNLTVLPILTETIDAEICDDDFYTFGNQNISTPGTYTETFTSSIGCDSTVTLNLTVLPTFTEAVAAEICDGDSYEFGNQTLTTGGTYTEVFTAENGCDSTVTLTLTILPTFTETIAAEICDGDSYEFGNQTLTTGGTYTEVFTAANGCDSTVTLTLTILPTFTEAIDVEICEGYNYQFGTQTLTADGTYTEVFTAANGCDSTVTLTLTVLPELTESISAEICEGETYPFDGQDLDADGTYTATFTASNGCDSTVTLTLTILPDLTESIAAEICEGETYPFDGQDLDTGGTYTATFTASNGCDSTVTLTLTILPDLEESITAEICEGETYPFDGQDLDAEGTYTATYTASNGCDSTVTLTLTILPDLTESITAEICEGETYPFDGQDLDTDGTYTAVFPASNGCDSTVTLTLTVLPELTESITAEICEGETYPFDGQDLDADGTYTGTFTASNGCDSTVTLTLTVLPELTESIAAEICDGETYTFDGQDLDESGTYTGTFTASSGCDSIVTLTLTVLPELEEAITAEICEGETYTFDGQDLDTDGTYTATYTGSNGCDSTVTLTLTVLPELAESISAEICEGETYPFDGQDLDTDGTYTAVFTASNGCDSTVTLTLTVLPELEESITAEICEGETYPFDGQDLDADGTYTAVFPGSNGCDSTVTLTLTVLPELTESITAEICEGETYTFDGQDLDADGTYTGTFTSSSGCDSIVTLTLTVLPELEEAITAEICEGETYTFDGQDLDTDGTYTAAYTGSNGCDSTVTLTLTVLPELEEAIAAEICDGETYTFDGQDLDTDGTYTAVFTASNGCDSTVTLTLTVLPTFEVTIDEAICEGDTYSFGGQDIAIGGTYTEVFTASNGCDSTVTLNLEILPELSSTIDEEICEGDVYEFGTQSLDETGTYTETFVSSLGCDSIVTLNLTVLPQLEETIDVVICEGESYTLGAQDLSSPGTYTETFISSIGCDSIVTLHLEVINIEVTVDNIICDDAGTPQDPSDDLFTFEITVTNDSLRNGWTTSNGETGDYNTTVILGPYLISDGDLNLDLWDTDQPDCITSFEVTAPPPCSEDCAIEAIVSNIICDDNGTPGITDDDLFYFDISATGVNVGDNWTATLNGDVLVPSAAYDETVTGLGPFNIIDGNLSVTVTDVDDPNNCPVIVEVIAPPFCSEPCTIAIELIGPFCDDNGTPSDPLDDEFTFQILVTGGGDDPNGWTDQNGRTGTYGVAADFGPFPISGGAINLVITDIDLEYCSNTIDVDPPATCSELCLITLTPIDTLCDVNGTPYTAGDDIFTFTLIVDGSNLSDSWVSNDASQPTGAYGTPVTFGPYDIADGDVSIVITDSVDPDCEETITIAAPEPCSGECEIEAVLSNVTCLDNGTPSNPNDDLYTYEITVSGGNAAGPQGWVDSYGTTAEYDSVVVFGPFPIVNGPRFHIITDSLFAGCFTTLTVNPPAPCSNTCDINAVLTEGPICDDNGTPLDPTDDAFSFQVTVEAANGSIQGWTSTDPNTPNGTYGAAANFGPYLISGGAVTITFTDRADPNCVSTITVTPPDACSFQCDIDIELVATPCDPNGTPLDPSDDQFYVLAEVTGINTGGSYRIVGFPGLHPYGQVNVIGPYPISGGRVCVEVYDRVDGSCTATICTDPPPTCAECEINAQVLEKRCEDNGTPEDPTDDIFYFDVIVTGQNASGLGWRQVDIFNNTLLSGLYGEVKTFGPYSIADGVVSIRIRDKTDSACKVDFTVTPPESCSDECDETVTLEEELCPGESVTFFDREISSAGTYFETKPGEAANGCDVIYQLTVVVLEEAEGTISATICEGETYTFGSDQLTSAGTYTRVLAGQAANGCDSTVILTLDVLPNARQIINASICEGESYGAGGDDFTEEGTYTILLEGQAANSCDSIITLNLTVHEPVDETVTATICAGEVFEFNGKQYDTAGTYQDVDEGGSIDGCDINYTIIVEVVPLATGTVNAEICAGETFRFNGQDYSTAGTYTHTIQGGSAAGCDSTVTLVLKINQPVTNEITATICEGETFTLNGKTYSQPGTYMDSETGGSADGCDSTLILHLDVNDVVFIDDTAEICEGESYDFFGRTLTTSGVYRDTMIGGSPTGCDVVNQLTLTVKPPATNNVDAEICEGETYTVGGEVFDQDGVYTVVLAGEAANGCDSTIVLTLTVFESEGETIEATICEGEVFEFNGKTYDTAGTYTDVVMNAGNAGCDVNYIIIIEVVPVATETVNAEICAGESIFFNGEEYDTAGSYEHTLIGASADGCDSIVTLVLTVNQPVTNEINATICAGETYTLNGETYSQPGTYTDVIENGSADGCDSTLILNLQVNDVVLVEESAEICEGETYRFGGVDLSDSGVYRDTMIGASPSGCDVVTTLTLTVQQPSTATIVRSICEGESIVFGGETYTESGTYTEFLAGGNAVGCDSTTTLILTVNDQVINEISATICEGESYEFEGQILTQSGVYTELFPQGSSAGCDSLIRLDLQVLEPGELVRNVQICTGESYTFNGEVYTTTGTYFDTIFNGAANGCDSLLVLNLEVEDAVTNEIDATICEGEPYTINGNEYDTPGTHMEVITGGSAAGCDSIIILNLEVETAVVNEIDVTICEGEEYTIGSDTYTTSGMYSTTIPGGAANGCDSTIILNLQVNQPVTNPISASFCAGDSYELNGTTYTAGGTYRDTLFGAAANGCDSILVLTLEELPVAINEIYGEICEGNAFEVNGRFYFEAGTYTDIIPGGAANGCDSILQIELIILPLGTYEESATICAGDNFSWNGRIYNTTGEYEIVLPGAAANGCDSVLTLNLTVLPELIPTIVGAPYLCAGEGTTVYVDGDFVSYLWSTGATTPSIYVEEPGVYSVTVTSDRGCEGTNSINIQEAPSPVADAGEDTAFDCGAPTVTLDGSGSSADVILFEWSGPGITSTTRNHIYPVVSQAGMYILEVTNGFGCMDRDTVIVEEGDLPPLADAGPNRLITCDVPEATLLGSTNSPNPMYTWSGPGINDSNRHLQNPTVSFGGVYTLVVEDTVTGCVSEPVEVYVGVNTEAPLAVIRQLGDLDCYTSVITLFGNTDGDADQYEFRWTQNGEYMGNGQSIQVTEGGWVVLSVLDTINGCPAIDSLLVEDKTEYPAANAGDPAELNCYQETAILKGAASNAPYITYTWTGPDGGIISGGNTLTPEVGTAGTYYLMVQDTINGCNRMDSVIVTIDDGSPIAILEDSLLLSCGVAQMIIDGSRSSSGQGISYQWTTIGGNIVGSTQVQNIEVSSAGLYIQSVFDVGNGCTDQDTILVYGPLLPNSANVLTTPSCADSNTGIIEVDAVEGGSPPYVYSINGESGPFSTEPVFEGLAPGPYRLVIEDVVGCQWDTTLVIAELDPIQVLVSARTDKIDWGDFIQLNGQTDLMDDMIDSLFWSPGNNLSCINCYDPIANPDSTKVYTFTVIDTLGCEGSASLTIYVDRTKGVYIPNAFSPNGDGENDYFTIYGNENVELIEELMIFDRWGELVFIAEDFLPNVPQFGWDGWFRRKNSQRPMNAAVFAFFTRVRFKDGTSQIFKGDLTLVR